MAAVAARQIFAEDGVSLDFERMRRWIGEYAELAAEDADVPEVATLDRSFDGPSGPMRIRLYNPELRDHTLYVHGGGWVMGSIESHDVVARWLAAETGACVVQVDYSLAPQHPYPRR